MIVLLDTDHFSILQHQSPLATALQARLDQLPSENLRVSIVSFQEQAQGWLSYINSARKPAQILNGFKLLQELLRHYHLHEIMPFDEPALDEFLSLKRQRIHVGTNDLRIAAIAKANGAKLLSRNLRDFRLVPGLDVEDWSV